MPLPSLVPLSRCEQLMVTIAWEIETWEYLTRFNHPGHKVLVKPGCTIKHRNVPLLKNNERLQTAANQDNAGTANRHKAADRLEVAE